MPRIDAFRFGMSKKSTTDNLSNGLTISVGRFSSSLKSNYFKIRTEDSAQREKRSLPILLLSSRSVVSDSVTPWTAARQASLSFTPGVCSHPCALSQ